MTARTVTRRRKPEKEAGLPRRKPVQKRGQERVERILAVATDLIAEKGSEAMRMGEIVERAGISFGSLYQYFPDKAAIIRTLAERYNAMGRQCSTDELAKVETFDDLDRALAAIASGYFEMFRAIPAMRDIWHATQADKLLSEIDNDDMEAHSQEFMASLRRLCPRHPPKELTAVARLTMQMLSAAVRYAISLPTDEAERAMTLYNRGIAGTTARLIGNAPQGNASPDLQSRQKSV